MIKFFRKIRQRLLSENKFSKYLIYAIGEIILVVIGILIAVQVNSTVNKNKQSRDNKVYLEKMISELELNKERMYKLSYGDTTVIGRKRWVPLDQAVHNCDSLLQMSYVGLDEADLPYVLNAGLDAGGSFLNIHNSVYEELINTGKLYSLGSDELTKAIKEYYKRCEREDLYNKVNSDHAHEGLRLLKSNLRKMRLDFQRDSMGFSIENYPWYFDEQSEDYQNIQLALADMAGSQGTNLFKMNQIRAYSDTLINVIKKELTEKYE